MEFNNEIEIIKKTFKDYDCHEDCFNKSQIKLPSKNVRISSSLRNQGNKLFVQKNHNIKIHNRIWEFYNYSIGSAPNGSQELASGFANRSALLLHLRKYEDSLKDISRALNITTSNSLKVKLLCRKTQCLVALQEGKQMNSLQKAKYWFNKIDDKESNKKILMNIIEKTENILENNVADNKQLEQKLQIQCDNDGVNISFNENYGKCLIATRDIYPGELVFIEKFYVTSVNGRMSYAYCNHCLAISWASIPCNNCVYCMYCSDQCKEEAWNTYHDIECSSRLCCNFNSANIYTQLSIKTIIKILKEMGNIEKLKQVINDIENRSDKKLEDFYNDEKFLSNSFRTIYSLNYTKSPTKINMYINEAVSAVEALALNSNIFGKINERNFKSIMKSYDVAFIGAILLRLMRIFTLNAFQTVCTNDSCKKKLQPFQCAASFCCTRGMVFSPISSLINHSCNNNVNRCFMNDGRIIYYALQKIKKDAQIFTSYYCSFRNTPKEVRQSVLKSIFDFDCRCEACKENWPNLNIFLSSLDASINFKKVNMARYRMSEKEYELGNLLISKHFEIFHFLSGKKTKDIICIEKVFLLAKDIEYISKKISQSSFFLQVCIRALDSMFSKYYSSKLGIPKKCKI